MTIGGWLRLHDLGAPHEYMFDEVYHVPTFILMSRGDVRAYQWWHQELTDEFGAGTYIDWLHPPLAKLIQAAFYRFLPEGSLAWRLPSAVMGMVLIAVVWLLARALWPDKPWAWFLAALLASIDGLAVAMSRIGMNDIFVTSFAALALWAYWRQVHSAGQKNGWLWAWVIFTGLSCASKWSGVWLLPFFGAWEWGRLHVWHQIDGKTAFWRLILVSSTVALIYLLSYGQMFVLGGTLRHLWALHEQIWHYQMHLDATHPYASKAWQWPSGLHPVLFYRSDEGREYWNRPFYPSWYLALGCLAVTVITLIGSWRQNDPKKAVKGHKQSSRERIATFARDHERELFLLLSYFALWTPWIFSPRIMYFHHYLPALPPLWVLSGAIIADLLDKPIITVKKIKGT